MTGAAPLFAEPLPPLDVSDRLDRLRETLPDAGVDGLLVTVAANIRWLTGFTGSAGLLLVTPQRAVLTSDGRYRTQSEEQLAEAGAAQAVDIVIGGVQVQREALVAAWGATANLGLEADDVTWSGQRAWDEALGSDVALVPTRGCVEALRQVKDAGEVARMERAAAIADEALASVVPLLVRAEAESVTEAFVAAALDHAMRVRGAEDSAFETIVASGPNSAKPHARPGDRQIRSGDPVVIDFGAIYEGYRSDMTRTFCVGGEPDGELARVFSVVAESQRVGVAAVAPGVVTGDVDRACRDVIAEAGWAERFEHGTGHGVGLDIHEAPSVGPGATAILAPGVVATVEPGVYLAGVGGVRIEDTLVVVEDGRRPLTMFPKDVSL
ncbi:MAG TPA: aminopeptidase P family protein [Acidimicrobiales bacterium]|nr:aminopeptidase P family protein [Acidimicrobiales bacterium]